MCVLNEDDSNMCYVIMPSVTLPRAIIITVFSGKSFACVLQDIHLQAVNSTKQSATVKTSLRLGGLCEGSRDVIEVFNPLSVLRRNSCVTGSNLCRNNYKLLFKNVT